MVSADMKTDETGAKTPLQTEMDRIEAIINSPDLRARRSAREKGAKAVQPRNAATILVVDRSSGGPRILMGRRNRNLAFMPGALVFPGGRVDPSDGSIPAASELAEPTRNKLMNHMRGRGTGRGARALGMAAVRELCEESGLLIGHKDAAFDCDHRDWAVFREKRVTPALSPLRLLSRAITPPVMPRRFDTWFFVAPAESIAYTPPGGFTPSGELEELQWLRPEDAMNSDTREITRVMLVELIHRLACDPDLDPGYPAPHYFTIGGRFRKSTMA